MIAALLGPHPASFYFFEEIDNGIHPSRLYLLLQLIEQQVSKGSVQVVCTSHSPALLNLLSKTSLDHASLIYRVPNKPEAEIRRILDFPRAVEVIENQSAGLLHATGWFEDMIAFGSDEEAAQ